MTARSLALGALTHGGAVLRGTEASQAVCLREGCSGFDVEQSHGDNSVRHVPERPSGFRGRLGDELVDTPVTLEGGRDPSWTVRDDGVRWRLSDRGRAGP